MSAREVLHFPVNTLALRRGGLVKAVMLRANALVTAGTRDVVIEVLAFQPRLEEDVADLVDRGFLDPRVHVRSILRCLDPAVAGPTPVDPIAGCVHHGLPLRRPSWIVRMLEYRSGRARAGAQRWIGRDGRCFLTVRPADGGREWGEAFVVTARGVQALPDPKTLYGLAFERALRDEVSPVLFSEFRDRLPNLPGGGLDEVVLSVRHPSLRRVAVAHSSHADGRARRLPLRSSPNFTALLTGLSHWDLLVTATEQQRADIAEQYGSPQRLAAIPHYRPDTSIVPAASYDPKRFVLVARIHRKKRVDEAIEAFRLVADDLSDARLEIYGFGYGDELEFRVRELVERLGLGGQVVFRGFVEDVGSIYAGACASLQTSESEGFGMALLESLAYGVPVVTYDVAYGPREVVRDDVDGFIVPWGDRVALARRLIELSTDPQLHARLAAAGPLGATRFSRERFVREWESALDGLPART